MTANRLLILLFTVVLFISCGALTELNSFDSYQQPSRTTLKTSTNTSYGKKSDPGQVTSWAYQKLLVKAIEARNVSDITKYIEMGANPNWGDEEYEPKSALFIAAKNGCKECIAAMATKADFNFSWKHSWCLPLAGAAQHSKDMVAYVVENYNVNVNATAYGRYGQETALASMVSKPKEGCIEYMLSKGANPNIGSPSPWYDYVFSKNIKYGKLPEVQAFIDADANLNIASSKTSVLGYAIDMKRTDIAKLLLSAGSNPNYCDQKMEDGYTPLYYAIDRNDTEMVKLLLNENAKTSCKYFNDCKCEGSLLDYASSRKNLDSKIIDLLLAKGAR